MSFEPQDQETVLFVGDSITHAGHYHALLATVCTLRHPERRVRWVNCGISGDTAGGALQRFDYDIAPHHPTQAFVLFGMNDGNRGLYDRAQASAAGNAAARAAAISQHVANMAALVARLQAIGTRRVILLSPTVYDQYTRLAGSTEPCGYDDALAVMGAAAAELAARTGAQFVDLHAAFLSALREEIAATPLTAFIREDRVHPEPVGHLLMAASLLEALGVPAGVGETVIGASGEVTRTRAEISAVHAAGGRLAWTVRAGGLPCAAPAAAWDVAPAALRSRWRHLNRDLLAVPGLTPGTYALTVDGRPVVTVTAAEWATGLDLAAVAEAPQVQQAAEVWRRAEARHNLAITRVRNPTAARMFLMWDRYALRQRGVTLPDDETAAARQMVAAGEGNPYVLGLYRDLLAHGSAAALAAATAELAGMDEAVRAAAVAPSRRVVLARV